MSDDIGITQQEALEMFGPPVEPIPPDEKELEVAMLLQTIRLLLSEATEEDNVGVNQLALRLGESPSVVSRMLRSEGDMRVSTAVLCAHALGRIWDIKLRKAHAPHGANHHWPVVVDALYDHDRASTTTSGNITQTTTIVESPRFSAKIPASIEMA